MTSEVQPRNGQRLKAYQDILNLDEESNSQLHTLRTLADEVAAWCNKWGPVDSWHPVLSAEFEAASDAGTRTEWGRQIASHYEQGHRLRQRLEMMSDRLPLEMWIIRRLWRDQCKVFEALVKGMLYIDIYLGYLAYSDQRTDQDA